MPNPKTTDQRPIPDLQYHINILRDDFPQMYKMPVILPAKRLRANGKIPVSGVINKCIPSAVSNICGEIMCVW